MIQLLLGLLAAEAALALSLLFRTPARRLALLAVDRAKWGCGPVMAKTVAGNMLLVLVSSGYSVAKIPHRADELGQLTPTDQVLASLHLLEAPLMAHWQVHGVLSKRLFLNSMIVMQELLHDVMGFGDPWLLKSAVVTWWRGS